MQPKREHCHYFERGYIIYFINNHDMRIHKYRSGIDNIT
ncbi:hypothetical protein [Plasmodium yoelii yoelii]|uniref:Uncharacterized protein n=1 Tax=Plasmodium yoelii yoelii TaxID=73239 RepID=Q7RJ97_PLAYO|nr:hypothetical protein [Plasmodium yoelii yoelii]